MIQPRSHPAGPPDAPPTLDVATASDADATPRIRALSTGGEQWLRDAGRARLLAWASLAWMTTEGVVGLIAGFQSGSIALVGWALGSAVEGLASIIVVWRFSGARTLSETAERRAQHGVAISFWLLAPYVAGEAIRDLAGVHHPETSRLGIGLTTIALLVMPLLGRAKQKLGARLDSGATAGEGRQNYLCAAQAAAVLTSLIITTVSPSGWRIDPAIALAIAAWAIYEGNTAWRGDACGC
jgi:divalent metal cation (Fe/Co/Zn/Cd) transporter